LPVAWRVVTDGGRPCLSSLPSPGLPANVTLKQETEVVRSDIATFLGAKAADISFTDGARTRGGARAFSPKCVRIGSISCASSKAAMISG